MSNLIESKVQYAGFSVEIFKALKNSLYPDAKDESILMVLDYCKAATLDPMQKPVHIVPMDVKTNQKNNDGKFIYSKRDVIMPGIGLYRTQASRSGLYAGMSEPIYGENITRRLGNVDITFPEWCKITVKKILGDKIVEFTAKEIWIENYAKKSSFDATPNAMWFKRPYGQIAKCTEAQALRKAFPELITSQPTAEEMEGKTLDYDDAELITEDKSSILNKRLSQQSAPTSQSTTDEKLLSDEIDYQSIAKKLIAAKTMPELSAAMNLTNKLTNPDEKKSALKLFRDSKAILEQQKTVTPIDNSD